MDKISDIVGKRLNQHKIGDTARASEVIYKANQYLSMTLKCEAEDVRATTLKNGVLYIKVAGPAWGQELWGVSAPLLKKLHDEYGRSIVNKVRTVNS